MADTAACLLELEGVTRTFPGVLAVEDVSLSLHAGEIHALVGENGAGKTTLIQLISGVLQPDAGTIRVRGQAVELRDPTAARRLGILAVHQELELFGTLSVAENLAFSAGVPRGWGGRVRWQEVERQARRVIESLDEPLPIHCPVARLTVAQRQLLLVAAAVLHQADVVLLDEPTSALTAAEADWLSRHLLRLRERGTGILYITHRHEEVFRLADCITVLRDGRRVWQGPTRDIDPAGLIRAMVGRDTTAARLAQARKLAAVAPVDEPAAARTPSDNLAASAVPAADAATPRLQVRGLRDRAGQVCDVSFSIAAGEVVGLYGLVGAGRSELAQTMCGFRASAGGELHLDGQPCRIRHPGDAVRAGLVYVPEDRLHQGLFRGLSVRANTVLGSLARWTLGRGLGRWWQSAARERQATVDQMERLGIRAQSPEQSMGELSGGNQQKVVLARWLLAEPRVLVLDEPTRGVDVAAKAEIQSLVAQVARRGAAVLWISSELPEVFACSDRLLVLRQGALAAEFDPAGVTADEVARAALPEACASGASARAGRVASRWQAGHELGLLLAVVALGGWLAATQPAFLTSANLLGVLNNGAVWTLLALAAAVVIITGAIDISMGSLFALSAGAAGLVLKMPLPSALAIVLAVAVGVVVGMAGGLLNAGVSLAGRLHPVVVTLGTMTIYRGVLIGLTGGETVADLPPAFARLANGRWAGLEGSIWWWLCVLLLMQVMLRHTVWGRRLYAVGSSHRAAWRVGISPERTWLGAFALEGALVGLAGVIELARNGSLQSGMGTGYELRAISAAVIGGTAITGGRGSVLGVALGALLLGLVYNGLVLWQVSIYRYDLVLGGLLLAAILLDWAWRRLAAGSLAASDQGL